MASPNDKGTSFQKTSRQKFASIIGTKISLNNNLFLASTGIPSLDNLVGGGVAVGTLFLLEEDTFAAYSHAVLKYFLAEGVICGHDVALASINKRPQEVLDELPACVETEPEEDPREPVTSDSNQMTIAWRYKNKPQVQSTTTSGRLGHYFDLSKNIPKEKLEQTNIETISCDDLFTDLSDESSAYDELITRCRTLTDAHMAASKGTRNVLRIGISGFGSALWGDTNRMVQTMLALRGLARSSLTVVLVTVPSSVWQNATLCRRLERLSDYAIRLESFAGSDKAKNPAFKEYHGLVHVRHLSRLNSLLCGSDTHSEGELAFKLRRKKFTIETLHLPPELGDDVSRPQEDAVRPMCGPTSSIFSKANKHLEF